MSLILALPSTAVQCKGLEMTSGPMQRATASSGSPGRGCARGSHKKRQKQGTICAATTGGQPGAPGPSSVSASQERFRLVPTILTPGVLNFYLCASSPSPPQREAGARISQGTPEATGQPSESPPNAGGGQRWPGVCLRSGQGWQVPASASVETPRGVGCSGPKGARQ